VIKATDVPIRMDKAKKTAAPSMIELGGKRLPPARWVQRRLEDKARGRKEALRRAKKGFHGSHKGSVPKPRTGKGGKGGEIRGVSHDGALHGDEKNKEGGATARVGLGRRVGDVDLSMRGGKENAIRKKTNYEEENKIEETQRLQKKNADRPHADLWSKRRGIEKSSLKF